MSIMQDFEESRKMIGAEKYDAIEKYLNEVCPKSNYDKYNKELNSLIDIPSDEWLKKKEELEKKYGIIFLNDILYKPGEWDKFETWYNEKSKTYIIELWENNADRNDGFGQIKANDIKDLGQAIKKAKEIFETTECVSIEVQNYISREALYFRDKVNEKYFFVEENVKTQEGELDEPEQ